MAIQWLESFDIYGPTVDVVSGGYDAGFNMGVDTTIKRTGPCAGKLVGNSGYVIKTVAPSPIKTIGAALYISDDQITVGSMSILSDWVSGWPVTNDFGNNAGCYGFKFSSLGGGGILIQQIVNGARLNIYTSATGLIPYNEFTYIEMVVNSPNQTLQIWRNGNQLLFELTGIANMPATYNQFAFGQSIDGFINQRWDDVYVSTGERLGAQRCYTLFPDADQSPQDWVPSIGASGFNMINDRAYDNANFVAGNVVGDISKFGYQNFPAPNASLNAMRVSNVLALDMAGSALVSSSITIGEAIYTGAEHSPSVSPGYYNDIFTLTGRTVSQINNMCSVIERIE